MICFKVSNGVTWQRGKVKFVGKLVLRPVPVLNLARGVHLSTTNTQSLYAACPTVSVLTIVALLISPLPVFTSELPVSGSSFPYFTAVKVSGLPVTVYTKREQVPGLPNHHQTTLCVAFPSKFTYCAGTLSITFPLFSFRFSFQISYVSHGKGHTQEK